MVEPNYRGEYFPPPESMSPPPQQPQGPTGPLGPEEEPPQETLPMTPEKRIMIIVSTLLFLVVLAFTIRHFVFSIRNLRVVGLNRLSWQEVARSAGLSASSNYFGLDEEQVKAGINANRYLVFEKMQKVLPNTLVLHVHERQPMASINYIGIAYIMADDGMILEKTRDLSDHGLPVVSGLSLRDIRQGSHPVSTRFGQMEACIALVRELHAQGFAPEVLDVNLSETSSIYLSTRDGFSVHLGDANYLRAKVGTVRAVLQKLREAGRSGGVIEATVPGEATYRPDSV